jgi:hypothetical protein
MTSDIDNLSLLFQDGLVSLAVQGLTLVVIAVVLVGRVRRHGTRAVPVSDRR